MSFAKDLLRQTLRRQLLIRSLYLLPSYVQIEPTAKCNLSCKTCIRSRANPVEEADMNLGLFKSIVDQLRQSWYKTRALNLTGLGEPFMNPNLVQMVSYAKDKGLNVGMNTNLTMVNEDILKNLIKAGLDWLTVSIDGATKETFENIRVGAIFEGVVENIKFTIDLRERMNAKRPRIYLNYTICEQNIQEIPEMIKLADDLRVNGIGFMKQVVPGISYSEKPPLNPLPENKWLNRKIKATFHLTVVSSCVVPRSCYITFDGKVLPCYPLYELVPRGEYSSYQFGDLSAQSLREIWFSMRYRNFRAKNISGTRLPICKSCPFGKVELNRKIDASR
ncbi:MAG: radical SAM protein [Candidatus Bathyarchaeia archaeon]